MPPGRSPALTDLAFCRRIYFLARGETHPTVCRRSTPIRTYSSSSRLETDLKREYYAEYRQVEDVHWWFVGRRKILLQVLDRYLGKSNADRRTILDVGCGTGTMLSYLAAYGNAQGIDVDEEAVGYCHERGLLDVRLGAA